MKNFKAKTEDEINNIIDAWHESSNINFAEIEIYQALGWTWEEYATWVETGKIPE